MAGKLYSASGRAAVCHGSGSIVARHPGRGGRGLASHGHDSKPYERVEFAIQHRRSVAPYDHGTRKLPGNGLIDSERAIEPGGPVRLDRFERPRRAHWLDEF